MKKFFGLFLSMLFCFAMTGNAFAAIDLTGVTLSVAPVELLAGTVLVALAAIWPIRKLIKLSNRS